MTTRYTQKQIRRALRQKYLGVRRSRRGYWYVIPWRVGPAKWEPLGHDLDAEHDVWALLRDNEEQTP